MLSVCSSPPQVAREAANATAQASSLAVLQAEAQVKQAASSAARLLSRQDATEQYKAVARLAFRQLAAAAAAAAADGSGAAAPAPRLNLTDAAVVQGLLEGVQAQVAPEQRRTLPPGLLQAAAEATAAWNGLVAAATSVDYIQRAALVSRRAGVGTRACAGLLISNPYCRLPLAPGSAALLPRPAHRWPTAASTGPSMCRT